MRLIGYNLLTAAVLLISIELGLRLVGFEFALAPPQVEFGWPEPVVMDNSFVVDPEVLWTQPEYPAFVRAARDWHPSVVFMGDSCTDYGRYQDELRSVVTIRDPHARFTFMNVGVGGWSSYSGLRQLQRDVLPMRPKAVTLYFGWNDHWKNFGVEDKNAGQFMNEPSGFRIGRLVEKTNFASMQRFEGSPYRVSLADFDANLRQMVRIAQAEGIIPILLTAPTSHRRGQEPAYLARRWMIDLEDLVPLHQQYVQVVREVAAEENAPLVDLHEKFSQLPRRDLEQLFIADGIHLTSEGDRKIAEFIDEHLVGAGLYRQIIGPGAGTEAEERFRETLDNARLLISSSFDVWLDGDRLLYVKDHCGFQETFFLHVVPTDPNDLPDHGKEWGFDNLDFDLDPTRERWRVGGRLALRARLDHMPGCVVARRLPDYPVATIRTGQIQCVDQHCAPSWEGEFHFTERLD